MVNFVLVLGRLTGASGMVAVTIVAMLMKSASLLTAMAVPCFG